jgi:Tfp pilus assembly protein PilF
LLVLIVLAVSLAHGLAIVAPFQFDDLHQIKRNPAFSDIAYLSSFFTDPLIGSSTGHVVFYRPLLFSSFLVDGLIGGGTPFPYRITSLVMLVLFAFVVRHFAILFLTHMASATPHEAIRRMASVAGLLVAVHPIFNEAVLLATSRSSLMMAIFGLLALARLLHPVQTRSNRLYAALLTLAALLTKETGVVLAPIAVLVSLLCTFHKGLRGRLLASWPIVVPVVVYVIFHETIFQEWVAARSIAPFPASLANKVSPLIYPAQGGLALIGFARLFFCPIGLSVVHEVSVPKGAAMFIGYAVWPVTVAFGIAAVRSIGRMQQVGIALLWFVIALAPTLALVRMNTPLAEHRAVIAVVMPLIALSCAIFAIRSERIRGTVVITLGVFLIVASMVQTIPWRSPADLWAHEVEAQPRSSRAWGFLADMLFEQGDFKGAQNAIANALGLSPNHPIYLARAAAIELATGNYLLAETYTREGLAVEQNLPMLHLVEAERLAIMGNLAEAYVHADRVTRLAPTLGAGWTAKGNVLYMQGNTAAAVESYTQALRVDPGNAAAAVNLKDARESRLRFGNDRQ